MAGRDLLYKPQVPTVLPDDATGNKRVSKTGTKTPSGRDLGGVSDRVPSAPVKKGTTAPRKSSKAPGAPEAKKPAYKAAYFTKDTSGVRAPNPRASNMQALRGAEGATDLRRIVIPSNGQTDAPDPGIIQQAGALMGLDGSVPLTLETFLARLGAWAHGEGMTLELLQERLRQMEAMVRARKAALARMARAKKSASGKNATLEVAQSAEGDALEQASDVAQEARRLIEKTAEQAGGMHKRLAKMLGIKR